MTYQEIKDRLSKCEYTLKCIKDGTLKEKDTKTIKKLELLKESLQTQLLEQEKGMVVTRDAEEAEKLAKKGVNVNLKTEGPHQTTYIKVSRKDYKKAIEIIDQNIDREYVNTDIVDDDGDGNVIIYFNFTSATTDHDRYNPDSDPAEFIYDLSMDLQANGINITSASHDVDETAQDLSKKNFSDYHKDNKNVDETDLNDPVLMKLRALQSKIAKKKQQKPTSSKHSAILSKLQTKRDQVMRDMEQEAEPEGGPIADKYGDMLNKIDAAIAKAKGTKPKSYDDTFKEGYNDRDDLFTFGYNLDMIQAVVDHLKSNYSEDDYELHVGRGDTHPNAVTLKNPKMNNDKELGDLLIAAEDQEETDYDKYRQMDEDKANQLSQEHLKIIASKAGKAVVKAVHDSGDEVARAKIKDVYASALSGNSSPEAFTVHIIYKNDSEVSYRFQIMNSALYFLDGNNDVKISDVDVKPSGEPYINVDLVRNEMTKYFKQMREMTDQEFADAQEADRLANHPEKDKLIAIQNLIAKEKGLKEVDLEEASSGPWTKHKLLAYLGQADDAMIRTHDDKYLIIYNPKNGNDDNAAMWNDDSVFGVDQDGEEHEVSYDSIDGLQLEGMKEQALGFNHIKKLGDKAASHIDIETRRDSRYTFGNRPYQDDQLRYQIAKKLGYNVDSLLEENSEMDKILQGRQFIKQLAPFMNKLPQDNPRRIKFINKVKQVNKKYKELLAKQDDKVSGIGKDQELSEGRGDFDDVLKAIENMANNDDISERDAAAEIVLALADKFQLPVDKNLEDYMQEGDLYENKLEEATDLYDRNGIQITRFSGGDRGLMLQINIGGKYIVVPADDFNNFIRALASIKDDVRDMKLQQPRDKYESAPGYKHDCAAKVVHEKYGKGNCIPEKHTLVKEGEKHVVTHYDVLFEDGTTVEDIPVSELEIKTSNEHWHKGYKKKKK